MRLAIFFLCLLIPSFSWAIAYTSNGTGGGNWSTVTTWAPNGNPASGDTAIILAGDTVTIDGNNTIGTAPGNTTTYDLDISGTLQWPAVPGANWTFTARSSVRINSGGKLQIGTSGAAELSCSRTATWIMDTNAGGQKYKIYVNGGQFNVWGCTDYDTASGSVHRAYISSCAPDCLAGAGRTITLDRTVDWNSNAGGWAGGRILVGSGGGATAPAAGDDPEEIISWTAPSNTTIGGVTLVEDHAIGDMVVNATKNVLFQANHATTHAVVTSTNAAKVFNLNWLMFDEFGDSTSGATSAINYTSNTLNPGTLNYVAVMNAEDGAGTTCFWWYAIEWDKFEGNVCYDFRTGRGLQLTVATTKTDITKGSIVDYTSMGSSLGVGYGIYLTTARRVFIDGYWSSHDQYGIYTSTASMSIVDSVFHHGTSANAYITGNSLNLNSYNNLIKNSIFKNSLSDSLYLNTNSLMKIENCDFDNAVGNCIEFVTNSMFNLVTTGNTFDGCNSSANANQAAIWFDALNGGSWFGEADSFGVTTANSDSNIIIDTPTATTQYQSRTRTVCNDCIFTSPAVPQTCGVSDSDIYFISNCAAGWATACGTSEADFFTYHNKNSVEGEHGGIGPGGMVFERQTGVVYTTSNLKLKITPCAATGYRWFPIGSVYVDQGDALSVDVYLRKDEAMATAGTRPRLALQGCGFLRWNDYDEMSDVNNTWEKVTVSGATAWQGEVHIWVGVKGQLSGADDYTPVWPPTLDVYVDGAAYTK